MIKDKRNIDVLFEEGLKKFKEKPPVYAWDRMDKSLNKVKFKKSMVYLRWMAASVLIILAFGAGYYYAIYNLNTPDVTADSKFSTPTSQTKEFTGNQKVLEENNNFSESSNTQLSSNADSKIEKIVQDSEKSKLLAQDNVSSNSKNEDVNSENTNIEISEHSFAPNEINRLQKVDFASLPVDLTIVNPFHVDDAQIHVTKTEIAAAYTPPMSLHYYPEDYNLKPAKKELENKWAVGAQFAPVVSYRDISMNNENQQVGSINIDESQLNNTEESLLSYAGGVDVNYHVSKRWSIQSGLYFSRIGQVNNDALNFNQENGQYQLYSINTSTGSTNITFEKVPDDIRKGELPKDTLGPIDVGNVKVVQNFDLFEVPVMVRYKLLNKRFGINLSGGLSPAYLVNNRTYLEVESNKHDIGSSENLNPLIFNTTLALGLNYGITKKLTINFEPTFKYSLSPINNNSGFEYHPYYFSWYTGVRYNF